MYQSEIARLTGTQQWKADNIGLLKFERLLMKVQQPFKSLEVAANSMEKNLGSVVTKEIHIQKSDDRCCGA